MTTVLLGAAAAYADGAELLIGTGGADITPSRPVALSGQVHTRIATEVESPVTATAVAIESRDGRQVLDQAIMVSCDLSTIRDGVEQPLRKRIAARLPDFDVDKLFLNATHTHTAPVPVDGVYVVPEGAAMQVPEYLAFLTDRLEEAVVEAWTGRRLGGVAWGLGHALVAHNRRAVYADGSARMYGATNVPDFRGIEGYEDHYVDVLFFFDADRKLIAMAVNVACPSQEVESGRAVNADFWHETRQMLRKRFGEDLRVLGWAGAGGDQSPHLMWYKRAEERMRALRGLTRLQEIARRLDGAVQEAYDGAKQDIRFDVEFVHRVKTVRLPVRMVTDEEFAAAKAYCDALSDRQKLDPHGALQRMWSRETVDRYQKQRENPTYPMQLHAIRVGDVAVCTNPFELYSEYGVRIRARSKAVQTFVVQLTGPFGVYLPTEKAVRGGHYSTEVFSNQIGPEGGNVLVDKTVDAINGLWD